MFPRERRLVRPLAASAPALLLIVLVSCRGSITGPDHFDGEVQIDGAYPLFLPQGQSVHLTASAWRKGEGFRVVSAEWTSDAPSIATVDQAGLVQSVSVGSALISAEYGRFRDLAGVEVVPNLTGTFSARLRVTSCQPVNGFRAPGATRTWALYIPFDWT